MALNLLNSCRGSLARVLRTGINPTRAVAHRGGTADPEVFERLLTPADNFSTDPAPSLSLKDWLRGNLRAPAPAHYERRDLLSNRARTIEQNFLAGVRAFEIDALPSKDGDAILCHHTDVHGASPEETRAIWDCTTKELTDMGYSKVEDVLTLLEHLQREDRSGRGPAKIYLELKGTISSDGVTDVGAGGQIAPQTQVLIADIRRILNDRIEQKKTWAPDQITVIGFHHGAVQAFPERGRGLSYGKESFGLSEDQLNRLKRSERSRLQERMLAEARAAGAEAVVPDTRLVTNRWAKRAASEGIDVLEWFPAGMGERRSTRMAEHLIVTDAPLALTEARARPRGPFADARLALAEKLDV